MSLLHEEQFDKLVIGQKTLCLQQGGKLIQAPCRILVYYLTSCEKKLDESINSLATAHGTVFQHIDGSLYLLTHRRP